MPGGHAAARRRGRAILETSAEVFAADLARHAGHDVRVEPVTLAASLGVGPDGIKTDRHDVQPGKLW
jgi:hypothetical protein